MEDFAHLVFVAIAFDDGSVGVMAFNLAPRLPAGTIIPGRDSETGKREATDEAIQYEIDKTVFPHQPVGWRRMAPSEAMGPADRTYRNAWKDQDGAIVHDMLKARDIHRELIRRARAALFAGLDAQWFKAQEQGDSATAAVIAAKKQALRDAPASARIDNAASVDELKSLTLDALVN